MLRQPLQTVFALAVLTVVTAVPALAADARPAGYERMMFPSANYSYVLNEAPDWAWSYSAVIFNSGGTPGFRIVDLEIDTFNSEPSNDEDPKTPDHVVSFVEARNQGDLQSDNWGVVLGETDFYWYLHSMNWRPIDLELYYRQDPFSGDVVATYAYVAVENSGKDYSDWMWIEPTNYQGFMNLLDQKFNEGWRPYDIEFAVDDVGQLVGTALLAPREGAESDTIVPTMWNWFVPTELPSLTEQGWQLLDVEIMPHDYDGGQYLAKYQAEGYRFGIFVNTDFVQTEDVNAGLALETTSYPIDDISKKMKGQGRLIDIENVSNYGVVPEGQAAGDYYDSVWLFKD